MSCILLIPILISDTTSKSKNNVFFSVFGKPKFLLIVAVKGNYILNPVHIYWNFVKGK